MGFNCAEAVNFAPADWLRFGELSRERYRAFRKPSLLCHEWLLFKVSRSLTPSEERPVKPMEALPLPYTNRHAKYRLQALQLPLI